MRRRRLMRTQAWRLDWGINPWAKTGRVDTDLPLIFCCSWPARAPTVDKTTQGPQTRLSVLRVLYDVQEPETQQQKFRVNPKFNKLFVTWIFGTRTHSRDRGIFCTINDAKSSLYLNRHSNWQSHRLWFRPSNEELWHHKVSAPLLLIWVCWSPIKIRFCVFAGQTITRIIVTCLVMSCDITKFLQFLGYFGFYGFYDIISFGLCLFYFRICFRWAWSRWSITYKLNSSHLQLLKIIIINININNKMISSGS